MDKGAVPPLPFVSPALLPSRSSPQPVCPASQRAELNDGPGLSASGEKVEI